MSAAELFTYADALAALDDFAQGHTVGQPSSALRRNILAAYREIVATHDWSFLLVPGRVQLVAPQTTGEVVYDLTGGATTERQLTLTDATFPSNAADYSIRFDGIVCDIERRYSDTVVSLDTVMSPGADVTSTTYSLWPRYYQLPIDFMSTHPDAYHQLSDAAVLEAIRAAEGALNRGERYYLPQDDLTRWVDSIRHGDIIAATSTVAGLDVAHTGIAFRVGSELHLLHAPLTGGVVEISPLPLAARILGFSSQDGIMVARPLECRNEC